jgi:hypothetical protein
MKRTYGTEGPLLPLVVGSLDPKEGVVLFLPGLDGSGCTLGPQVRGLSG